MAHPKHDAAVIFPISSPLPRPVTKKQLEKIGVGRDAFLQCIHTNGASVWFMFNAAGEPIARLDKGLDSAEKVAKLKKVTLRPVH